MPLTSPRLWVVATPIGNIGDLSDRARSVLQNADLILAEDTRRTGKVLQAAGVSGVPVISFFEQNEQERQPQVLAELEAGKNVALVTDAGTPLMADPGYRLVRACRKQGIAVSAIPGASAPVVALAACGIPPLPYIFLGFLPRGQRDKQELFEIYGQVPATLVFFERKNRLAETLAIAHAVLGNRELAICRELTKIHEEFLLGTLAESASMANDLLGEITVVIGPPWDVERTGREKVVELLQMALERGLKPRDAAREVRARVSGWSTREVYALLTEGEKDG